MRVLVAFSLLVVLSFLAGCGGPPPKAQVSGKVQYQGKGLPDGEIVFANDSGKAPETLKINDGNYTGEVTVGKHKVQIYGFKVGTQPKTATGEGGSTKENYIPAKWNAESKEEREVTKAGPNNFDFDIK